MVKSLSDDLRVRVVAAVEAGASRRQAAARFGVSVSSAIRWVRRWRDRGEVGARPQGGDRRSGRIEAQAGFLLGQVEQSPDVTLAELQALLFERGVAVGIATLWRFFERRGISFKKKRTPPSRTGPWSGCTSSKSGSRSMSARPLGARRRGWRTLRAWRAIQHDC